MLLLKRHLVDLVRAGKKRQTIRIWSRPMLKPGQITYTPGLGRLRVTAIDILPSLAALTEADARADGFPSLLALRNEITKIYGPTPDSAGRTIFRIRFDWPITPPDQPSAATPRAATAAPPATPPNPPKKPRPSPPKPPSQTAKPRQKPMTRPQKRELRAYILGRAPC